MLYPYSTNHNKQSEALPQFFMIMNNTIREVLESNGFEVVEIAPTGGFFSMMAIKINYFTIRMFKLPRLLWKLWLILLIPFWSINQIIAPFLDKLFDRNYELETMGFWVIASKKDNKCAAF